MQHRQASKEPTRKIARAQHRQNLSEGKEWQSRVDDAPKTGDHMGCLKIKRQESMHGMCFFWFAELPISTFLLVATMLGSGVSL